jgi:hypothetical protein
MSIIDDDGDREAALETLDDTTSGGLDLLDSE